MTAFSYDDDVKTSSSSLIWNTGDRIDQEQTLFTPSPPKKTAKLNPNASTHRYRNFRNVYVYTCIDFAVIVTTFDTQRHKLLRGAWLGGYQTSDILPDVQFTITIHRASLCVRMSVGSGLCYCHVGWVVSDFGEVLNINILDSRMQGN